MTQLLLWKDDVRVPDVYVRHFETTGRCLNCGQPLRAHMHAMNHLKKCHTQKAKPKLFVRRYRYWVWKKNLQQWCEVGTRTYNVCKRDGFATARSKFDLSAPKAAAA